MSIVSDFVAEIQTIQEVTDLVGTRVYPVVDIGQQTPSIVYNTRGGGRESYVQGSFGLRETFIQLDCYASQYSQLDTLRSALLEHFNGYVGNFNSAAMDGGTFVTSCQFVTSRELTEGQNPLLYRMVIEFNILSE